MEYVYRGRSNIFVYKDEEKAKSLNHLARISDGCCFTNINIDKLKNVVVYNQTGKGGFVVKPEYRGKLIDLFERLYNNQTALDFLKDKEIRFSKENLDSSSYIQIIEGYKPKQNG